MRRLAIALLAAVLPLACSRSQTPSSKVAPRPALSTEWTGDSASLDVPVVSHPQTVQRMRRVDLFRKRDTAFDVTFQLVAHPDAAAARELNRAILDEVRADEAAARANEGSSFSESCETGFFREKLVKRWCPIRRGSPGKPPLRDLRVQIWFLHEGHARRIELRDVLSAAAIAEVDALCLEHIREFHPKAKSLTRLGALIQAWEPVNLGVVLDFPPGAFDDSDAPEQCEAMYSQLSDPPSPSTPLTALLLAPAPSASASH